MALCECRSSRAARLQNAPGERICRAEVGSLYLRSRGAALARFGWHIQSARELTPHPLPNLETHTAQRAAALLRHAMSSAVKDGQIAA
ncbi:hypothetical protein NDU88_009721 [Pleurodeles waltl]|uniref:Uncharacterized protein n=1 Tax=Pleurodeles waltl TaxID=8319 RepID=A0AAV7QSD3_PLEWA|nr:hypothetical protein NDU88_009721 [Pleurodeles waltl]